MVAADAGDSTTCSTEGETMSSIRRVLLPAAAAVAATGLALSSASPASAWTWTNGSTVYNGGGLCVQGDAGIDHAGSTFSGNLAYANTYARGAGCGAGLANQYAAVRLEVLKWNGSSWFVCRATNWEYGYTGVNQWGPYGPSQGVRVRLGRHGLARRHRLGAGARLLRSGHRCSSPERALPLPATTPAGQGLGRS
jgi:hypothetical protein